MRIVILLPKLHAAAELALNRLIHSKKIQIVGVIRSDISPWNKNYWNYVKYGLRRAGLFYGILIGITAYLPFIGLGLTSIGLWQRRKKWQTVNQLSRKTPFNLYDTKNINSPETIKTLKSWRPDLVISISFDQILKKQTIRIAKIATLNVHPGLLPRYKGLWPEFWKLHNKEKYSGVTIHHINEKIDSGNVIAQIKFRIKKNDTKFSLALRSAQHGSQLLIKILTKIKQGAQLPTLKLKGKPRYYSLPKKHHLNTFFERGKKLYHLPTFWRELKRHI